MHLHLKLELPKKLAIAWCKNLTEELTRAAQMYSLVSNTGIIWISDLLFQYSNSKKQSHMVGRQFEKLIYFHHFNTGFVWYLDPNFNGWYCTSATLKLAAVIKPIL